MIHVFALKGAVSRELISFGGRVLIHDNRQELEFLFPKMQVVEVTIDEGDRLVEGRLTMPIREHPDLDMVRWPLNPKDFNLR